MSAEQAHERQGLPPASLKLSESQRQLVSALLDEQDASPTTISVAVPASLARAASVAASLQGISRSELVRQLLSAYLQDL